MEGKRPSPPAPAAFPFSQDELGRFYQFYLEFTDDLRDSVLRIVSTEASRISIRENVQPLTLREFEAYLRSMASDERGEYLRQLHGGCEFSHLTAPSRLGQTLLRLLGIPPASGRRAA